MGLVHGVTKYLNEECGCSLSVYKTASVLLRAEENGKGYDNEFVKEAYVQLVELGEIPGACVVRRADPLPDGSFEYMPDMSETGNERQLFESFEHAVQAIKMSAPGYSKEELEKMLVVEVVI